MAICSQHLIPGNLPRSQLPVPEINERQLCEVLALQLTLYHDHLHVHAAFVCV